MLDAADPVVFAPGCMATTFKLRYEVVGTLAPLSPTESQELARNEVAGMHRYNIEKAGFIGRVAECLEGGDILVVETHRERISAVSAWPSSTQRKRFPSPRGV